MTQKSLLPLLWNDELVVAVDRVLREINSDLASNPHTHDTDDDGRWLGPMAVADYYAEDQGNLAWTQNLVATLGEAYGRRVLGDRIVGGVNHGRYSYLLNQAAGRGLALQLLGELRNSNITWRVGVFTKVDPDDKSTWDLTEQTSPSTVRPTGIDVILFKLTDEPVSAAEQTYLNEVIPRLLPFTLVDYRIQVLTVQETRGYTWTIVIPQNVSRGDTRG